MFYPVEIVDRLYCITKANVTMQKKREGKKEREREREREREAGRRKIIYCLTPGR